MNFKFTKRICALFLASLLTFGTLGIHAAAEAEVSPDGVKVIFENVTNEAGTTEGQAKIKVSITGIEGYASAVQLSLRFSEGMNYDSIFYLLGEDNPPVCFQVPQSEATVNSKNALLPAVVAREDTLELTGTTELFVVTFEGEPGDTVKLWVDDLELSYCTVDGEDVFVSEKAESEEVAASETENKGTDARIRLDLSGILSGFGYTNSEIKIDISNKNSSKQIVVNADDKLNGGHREADIKPIFTIDTSVVDDEDNLYTVKVSGIGYTTATYKNVYFGDLSTTEGIEVYDKYSDNIDALLITHEDFVPGDVTGDGKIEENDYTEFNELLGLGKNDKDYSLAADFDRNGKIDDFDLKVYDSYGFGEEKQTAPGKVVNPSVSGGENKIVIKWTAPEDDGGSEITNYVIKYGTSSSSLGSLKEPSAKSTEYTISSLKTGTTYYVQIAAENAIGIGEYSDVISAATTSGGGGGGGGGTVGGGGGGAVPLPVNYTVTYNIGNGTLAFGTLTETVTAGATPTKIPTVNAPAGMTFEGWAVAGTTAITNPAETKITANTTFVAQYKEETKEEDKVWVNPFKDVTESDWYYESVKAAFQKGLMNGISAEEFSPSGNVTRAMFVTVLYRMENQPEVAGNSKFTDVEAGSWYEKAVLWASTNGIVNGVTETEFSPNANITREQMAAMVYRYAKFNGKGFTGEFEANLNFSDAASVSSYAYEALSWCTTGGIINGMGDGTLAPQGNSTRAQAATVFIRTLAALAK